MKRNLEKRGYELRSNLRVSKKGLSRLDEGGDQTLAELASVVSKRKEGS